MNFQTFSIAIDPKVEKIDYEVFSRYQERILAIIKDDYFSEFYDSIFKICYITVVSELCVIFQVSAIKQDFTEDEQETCPSRASFFVCNFHPSIHCLNFIKFHDANSLRDRLWENLVEVFEKQCEKFLPCVDEDEDDDEECDFISLGYHDYEISYTLVIKPGTDLAVFMIDHYLFYINPEDHIVSRRNSVASSCVIFKIQGEQTDRAWFIPSVDPVDLSSKIELV